MTPHGWISWRKSQLGPADPITAVTALAMKGDAEKCMEAGMDGYVSKPIKASELFQKIKSLV